MIASNDAGLYVERNCGSWAPAPTVGPQATTFGAGAWIVNADIAPGTYRSTGTDRRCIWERRSGFGGTFEETIALAGTFALEGSEVIQTVNISATDVGFSTDEDCGSWSLVPTLGPQATTFGTGTWVVGVEIAPGTYRSTDTSGDCVWNRLSGFGGTLDEWVASDFTEVVQTVTISAADISSASEGFGRWTLVEPMRPCGSVIIRATCRTLTVQSVGGCACSRSLMA